MTIKEIIKKYGRLSDDEIIFKYIIENDKEIEMIEIITRLAKSKADKIQQKLDYAKKWLPIVGRPIFVNEKGYSEYYDDDTERNLTLLQQLTILNDEFPETLLQWAKETIPTLKRPFFFFKDTEDRLKKYDIQFDTIKDNKEKKK